MRDYSENVRKMMSIATLVFSDVLLASLVWYAASIFQGAFGRNEALSVVSAAGIVPSVGVWVVARALLGLYPGYDLGYVEELLRQAYAVAAALAITLAFALAFQVGDLISRLLLVSGYLALLVWAPPLRYFVKWRLRKVGLWPPRGNSW
jgi:hypothetical protein